MTDLHSHSMATEKRTSYPSKQIPAGPAPLASFEDLPSDELESPEDLEPLKDDENISKLNGDAKTKESSALLSSSTLDSLTISAQSTPQVDKDFDSNFTLTPVESKTLPSSGFRTGSLSSLNKEDTSLVREKKGSVSSLDNYENIDVEYNQRKSSWTDIFRSHNPSVRSISEQGPSNDSKGKSTLKVKSEPSKEEEIHESKPKERGKFLSLFKVGKKGNKPAESSIPVVNTPKEEKRAVDIIKSEPPVTKLDFEDSKENEHPKGKDPPIIMQMQNDLDKTNNISEMPNKSSCEIKITRKNFNISEKDYNIFSSQVDEICEKTLNKCETILKNLEDDHESSECELSFDFKVEAEPKKDDEEEETDFEAEKLLPQDSSEIDDDSACELHPIPIFPSQMARVSRPKTRTDVATIPVERPRSTTPINAAPLEAYIRAASPSSDRKMEKIKLSLPGEQFIGHLKSPKKNTTKSWSDFCEEILHSPRAQKKDDFGHPEDIFAPAGESKENEIQWNNKSPNQWVTFETKTDNGGKICFPGEELKSDGAELTASANVPLENQENKFIKCACECHSNGCDNKYINNFTPLGSNSAEDSLKIDVFSDKCQCICHKNFVHLWSPSDFANEGDLFCDTRSSELFSDFAPASDAS